ncbi:MAG: efflux RND transporter periplasmic adaptor subunit, partial [Gemmatimonadales bacterium]
MVLGALPAVLLGAGVGIALYWGLSPSQEAAPVATRPAGHEEKAEGTTLWTCSMHPEVRLPKPGPCPKCGMKLIPLKVDAGAPMAGLRELVTSETAKALMKIETATVERMFPTARIRMVGKIDYDETRLAYITAWVPGRLDRLFVDYTGVAVRKGEHMVYLYSPELYSSQEELLQALQAVKNLEKSDVRVVQETAKTMVDAAREKLRLLGLTAEQVAEVEQRGKAEDHVTVTAPVSGIVIHKNAQEGMYVQTGTRIYTLADLSVVWAKLDAYESDLSWLRYGQKVEFTSVSYPGEVFAGTISFIDPVLNPVTRTVKVRVNVPNPQGKLKPEMFVDAVVYSQVAAGGRVMEPDLAGKWISPMHPEIVRDEPGPCPVCGMPLVKAESLGYVGAAATEKDKPLVIPVSAALVTGTRAIVYLEKPGTKEPTYEGREIVLGPRAGDYYLVRRGLAEGDHVVTRGNFKIDSALQIQAKPSMMTPEGGGSAGHQHGQPARTADGAATPAAGMELPPLLRQQLEQVLASADKARQQA